MLDNEYSILFIRGERPIKDKKYNILKHPNVKFTADGKENPYFHGETNNAIATINIDLNLYKYKFNEVEEIENYELISSEYIDDYFRKIEEENKSEKD